MPSQHGYLLHGTDEYIHRGEKTADVLESNLSNLEKKIDDLLASFEESERSKIDNGGKKSPELPKEVADEQTDHATGGKS